MRLYVVIVPHLLILVVIVVDFLHFCFFVIKKFSFKYIALTDFKQYNLQSRNIGRF